MLAYDVTTAPTPMLGFASATTPNITPRRLITPVRRNARYAVPDAYRPALVPGRRSSRCVHAYAWLCQRYPLKRAITPRRLMSMPATRCLMPIARHKCRVGEARGASTPALITPIRRNACYAVPTATLPAKAGDYTYRCASTPALITPIRRNACYAVPTATLPAEAGDHTYRCASTPTR
jgi:hypothetical protein